MDVFTFQDSSLAVLWNMEQKSSKLVGEDAWFLGLSRNKFLRYSVALHG